jgi:hypothetical protein
MDAVSRLRELPETFTFATFLRVSGLSADAAAVYLRRWRTKGLIEPAGDRAGIYFNRIRQPEIDSSRRIAALLFEYPSAILCGESVLHAAGWITQIPAQHSVAVLQRRSYVTLHGFRIYGRSRSWFEKVHEPVSSKRNLPIYGLRALPPAYALADLYADPKAWHPDMDDLDIPPAQFRAIRGAANRLEVTLPDELERLMSTKD